jgi:class 3 adenylate cyclase
MGNIEDLLRRRKDLLDKIDREIRDGYTKPVTLLFADIVDSTSCFEAMGDIEGRQMIQTRNDLLFPIIGSLGGLVIKTIGDSIIATFENPENGVRSAVAMQEKLADFNRCKPEKQTIRVRMGLHYGSAVVDDKDLSGDMVNTAARVEAKARGDEIIISSRLKEELDLSLFPLVFLGNDRVKGKTKEIGFYLVNWNDRKENEIKISWEKRNNPTEEPAPSSHECARIIIKRVVPIDRKIIPPVRKQGNPYLNRGMLQSPWMFFGREAIVKRIMARISSEKPQSVSVVGERRIGKSSLLNFLNFAETRLAYLKESGKYIFTFIDFQQVRSANEAQLLGAIFYELKKQSADEVEINLSGDLDGMRSLCECFYDEGYRLVFFFDEFESITRNENIGPDFYSFFRSLANNHGVGFVTASGKNLKDMCVSHQISDSPFFNIFSVLYVGLFGQTEARLLVCNPSAESGLQLEPVSERIIADGGLYPFFLQIMCAAWYEYLEAEGKRAEDFAGKETPREVLSFFREETEPHFEYVLETFHARERDILRTIVSEKSPDIDDPYFELLERKGYILREENGIAKPFGKEFGYFLKKRFS